MSNQRTLAPTYRHHWCTPGCLTPCDIKGHMVWHHEEVVRYTSEELAAREHTWAEWREQMRQEGRLP